jgi:AcrR family transcriptional regulator
MPTVIADARLARMTEQTSLRRGRPGYDQRGILEVAVAAFNEHGYDATSMGVIADRLGLTKAAIYHHFASKEAMLELALDEALGGLEGTLREADAAPARPAADRLDDVLRGAVRVLVEQLPHVTLLLRVRGNTEVERQALARRRAFDRAVTELVRVAQAEGSVRSDIDAGVVARLLFGMINSIVEWYRPGGREGVGRLADDVVAVALDGLRTAPAAASVDGGAQFRRLGASARDST